ncbi:MAG: protein kinase [Deltaproteobacteria bacterium]|nr:protein kinase [Deltaproteobacteria bacterium]
MAADEEEDDDTVSDAPRKKGPVSKLPARFTVKGTLGEGGMGTVVEAYDRVLSRDVAIKILGAEQHADPAVGTRFLREARAAARLRHPGIVQVHDVDVDGGFIVMEIVRGESLSARLWREKKLPVEEVRRIGSAIARALAAAHAEGIIHRDVKPANVLLGTGGEIKLADFGVAHFGDSELTMPGTRVGTPAYMAPEQLRGKDVDARADVYSAGVTLFEAAIGERPADERDADHYAQLLAATGDQVLSAAITRAIRDRASERFADGAAFASALEATEVPASLPKAKVPAPRARWPIALAVIACAGAAGGIARYMRDHHAKAPVAAHRTIALLPFTETTKNPMLDFASAGLPNLLGLELHGVSDVNVIGYYKLVGVAGQGAPHQMWVAAAKQLGADIIVEGEITGSGDNVHVAIAVDGIDGRHIDRIERDASVQSVPEVVRQTAPSIAKIVVGHDVDVASASHSFDADRELQLGIAALEREKLPEAVDHLKAAIHHDPANALAHYYYAIALTWSVPPAEPALAEIDAAVRSGKLDDAQKGLLGGAAKIATLDYAGCVDVMRPLAERYPDNREVLYVLFECLFHGGQPAEAMSIYRRINAIAPKFRLALIHAFTFYVSHFDEQGITWVLSLAEPTGDAYNPGWEPDVLSARREYGQVIELMSRELPAAAPDVARIYQGELLKAYMLSGQTELAEAILDKLAETWPEDAPTRLGFANVRGDEAARRKWLDASMRGYATLAPGPTRALSLAMLVSQILPVATRADLEAIRDALPDSLVPGYERSLNMQLGQALLADALDDTARVTELATAPYPEVAELAHGILAHRAGDHAAAIRAFRASIAASGDARFLMSQWWLLARELAAASDHTGVVSACDEVIRPRLIMNWGWGAYVSPCLQLTAEADEAVGKIGDARAAWTRIVSLRTKAPAGDPLVTSAKAALARLPQQ